mgnify:CR=1 FL=1
MCPYPRKLELTVQDMCIFVSHTVQPTHFAMPGAAELWEWMGPPRGESELQPHRSYPPP